MTKLRSVSVLLLLAVSLAAASARADDASELERAKTSYDAGRYAEGVERFREILNPAAPSALHEPAAIERMLELAVEGLISDYPDRVRSMMARRGLQLPPEAR